MNNIQNYGSVNVNTNYRKVNINPNFKASHCVHGAVVNINYRQSSFVQNFINYLRHKCNCLTKNKHNIPKDNSKCICPKDTIDRICRLVYTFDKKISFSRKNVEDIKTALDKYSIDTDAEQFVKECLDCIENNLYNRRLYNDKIAGTPLICAIPTEDGNYLLETMICALNKALDPKSKFNINTKEKEGLQKCIAESRKFMKKLN